MLAILSTHARTQLKLVGTFFRFLEHKYGKSLPSKKAFASSVDR